MKFGTASTFLTKKQIKQIEKTLDCALDAQPDGGGFVVNLTRSYQASNDWQTVNRVNRYIEDVIFAVTHNSKGEHND